MFPWQISLISVGYMNDLQVSHHDHDHRGSRKMCRQRLGLRLPKVARLLCRLLRGDLRDEGKDSGRFANSDKFSSTSCLGRPGDTYCQTAIHQYNRSPH